MSPETRRADCSCFSSRPFCLWLVVVPMLAATLAQQSFTPGTRNAVPSADPLSRFRDRLSLPLIAAPMFLVSGVELVVAACRNGVIGAFPTVNCRSSEQLEAWLGDIESRLRQTSEASGKLAAPICPNL